MRILVISDSHGNTRNIERAVEADPKQHYHPFRGRCMILWIWNLFIEISNLSGSWKL